MEELKKRCRGILKLPQRVAQPVACPALLSIPWVFAVAQRLARNPETPIE